MMGGMDAVSLAIIAGGLGRRLGGRVKAHLEVEGETVLTRLLRLARPGESVVVVTQRPDAFPGLRCVPDVEAGRGAPGGVVTALLTVATPWVLVVASDMPALEARHRELLEAAARDDVEVVAATRDGRLEPLFALYRTNLGARWRATLKDEPSLRSLISSVPHATVALEPGALDSLNTPDDLARHHAR
ncbi:MAG: molybdenum cofactor guanylyltransferase [Myxococcaceae bacterium]|nr:molybdenum cofactor guanylyltransferase [Myxococcaceae bacterium]